MPKTKSSRVSPEVIAAVKRWAGKGKKNVRITRKTLLSDVLPKVGRKIARSRILAQLAEAAGKERPFQTVGDLEKFFNGKK